ncbi:hypothetical protein C8Q75DRAFT_812098 [Abortiporus biennis]|nr:hypothetical protein C8Q75DRAFT_812098 [Abortiporus biennis]
MSNDLAYILHLQNSYIILFDATEENVPMKVNFCIGAEHGVTESTEEIEEQFLIHIKALQLQAKSIKERLKIHDPKTVLTAYAHTLHHSGFKQFLMGKYEGYGWVPSEMREERNEERKCSRKEESKGSVKGWERFVPRMTSVVEPYGAIAGPSTMRSGGSTPIQTHVLAQSVVQCHIPTLSQREIAHRGESSTLGKKRKAVEVPTSLPFKGQRTEDAICFQAEKSLNDEDAIAGMKKTISIDRLLGSDGKYDTTTFTRHPLLGIFILGPCYCSGSVGDSECWDQGNCCMASHTFIVQLQMNNVEIFARQCLLQMDLKSSVHLTEYP